MLAWRALKQGLRYAQSNWRMWANYMIVSIDVGELSEAARALDRIVKDRSGADGAASVDVDVLDKLVDSVMLDDYSLVKEGKVVPRSSNEGFCRSWSGCSTPPSWRESTIRLVSGVHMRGCCDGRRTGRGLSKITSGRIDAAPLRYRRWRRIWKASGLVCKR